MNENGKLFNRTRRLLGVFIAFLILSGLTAFPLLTELRFLGALIKDHTTPLAHWIQFIHSALEETYAKFPFFGYGTDWLAFGHFVIATFFVQAYRSPIQNRQIIDSGIIACILVIPTALICGSIREIPLFWRLFDCTFGIFGLIPLVLCRKYVQEIVKTGTFPR